MLLFFDGINQGQQCTHVGHWVKNYESAFERLTELVAQEWLLQRAVIVDGYDRIRVPVEAFDGQPIEVHIRSLQREWQRILLARSATYEGLTKPQLRDWYHQLDAYYEDMLAHLEKMILLLELRKTRLEVKRSEAVRSRLTRQYNNLLSGHKRMHKQTKTSQRINRRRIKAIDRELK